MSSLFFLKINFIETLTLFFKGFQLHYLAKNLQRGAKRILGLIGRLMISVYQPKNW